MSERDDAMCELGEAAYRWMVAFARSLAPDIHDPIPEAENVGEFLSWSVRHNHRTFGWVYARSASDKEVVAAFQRVADLDDWRKFREPPQMCVVTLAPGTGEGEG